MATIPRKDIPRYIRRCWDQWRTATAKNREAEKERLKFYIGDQWSEEEKTKRKNQNRPFVTINKCKPAVDQVEGDIRLNPPGPQVHPVGGGADPDTADIWEGLIREVEYRSDAKTAYSTAGKYSAASGYGVIELVTEWSDERSFDQRLRIESVEDPETVFFDPTSRMANRQDASWAGKLKMYTRSEYIGAFGDSRAVLKPRWEQKALGWIQDAIGYQGEASTINEWTGGPPGPKNDGPFFVCEFYMVELDPTKLRLCSDEVARFADEPLPKGVTYKAGEENTRIVPRRTIRKYIVDALEILDDTEWLGRLIPLFPVLGPEVYIEGKLHRLSLISGALDSNRACNYVATTATELAGALPKAPWIGAAGSFDDPRWQTANSEMWAYLEYTPIHVPDPVSGATTLAPPPQRNNWEAPIQWLVMLFAMFSDSIKAVTAIYDPSLGQQKGDQSGKAIQQLRSESNVGNFSYADNLHRAIAVMYGEIIAVSQKILSGPRVQTIVRADSQHEQVLINQIFDENPQDATPGAAKRKANNISRGEYAVRVIAGPNFETRQEQAVVALTSFFQAAPQALAAPGVASAYLRMIGEGNPKVEVMADLLSPQGQDGEATPEQAAQQLQQATAQNKALTTLVQKLGQERAAKLPEIEAQKWKAALDSLTKIRVAEISASKDADKQRADAAASLLEHLTGLAHDAGMQAQEHAHQTDLQADQQDAAARQQQAAAEQEQPTGVE